MKTFEINRGAVPAAASIHKSTRIRSYVISITIYSLVLILSLGTTLRSAHAQSSSGKVLRRPTATDPAPVPVDTGITTDEVPVPVPQAGPGYEFVGSYRISNGPYWAAAPPCYTAREAAAQIFGGLPTDYAISVNSNTTDPTTITHTAFLDGYGNTQFFTNPQSEDFKSGTNYTSGTFSALVHDHNLHGQGPINYVWRLTGLAPTPVAAGDVLISEFRFGGPSGTQDEYVELYNNTASQLVVGGNGWALRSSDNVTRFVVPAGVIIPARGHYLAYGEPDYSGNRYSLSHYGGTNRAVGNINFQTDIPASAGIALFSSTTTFDASTRIDSVGFSNVSDPLYFEGAGLSPSGGVSNTIEYAFVRRMPTGPPQDTNNNANDFVLLSTTGAVGATVVTLGAPGPETLSSPIERNAQFAGALLDPAQNSATSPNRSRDLTPDPANCATFGTMTIRRTITNNTGAVVTRLRFRTIVITSFPSPMGVADLRSRSIADSNVFITGGSSVLVRGTTLEAPPSQPACGGLNSSLSLSSVTPTFVTTVSSPEGMDQVMTLESPTDTMDLNAPLAIGASINLQFLFGVQQTGKYKFFVNVEALP